MSFKIIRFRKDKEGYPVGNQTIKHGLTEKEAQEHCQREDTHGEDWFDGYTKESKLS
jgi:hypothetical protein|tara:strand:- start:380 stop:550 length:171 start_codon:yes stop_codon:yes gene_type:complete